jgi:hypothetical protein
MKYPKLTLASQWIAALLLAVASILKWISDPGSVEVFVVLDMEPTGRYVIATIEMLAALLLISPFASVGALLAVSVMCGAIIAHLTQLGIVVNGDGGMVVGMLLMVLVTSAYVLISRRQELPLVGETL